MAEAQGSAAAAGTRARRAGNGNRASPATRRGGVRREGWSSPRGAMGVVVRDGGEDVGRTWVCSRSVARCVFVNRAKVAGPVSAFAVPEGGPTVSGDRLGPVSLWGLCAGPAARGRLRPVEVPRYRRVPWPFHSPRYRPFLGLSRGPSPVLSWPFHSPVPTVLQSFSGPSLRPLPAVLPALPRPALPDPAERWGPARCVGSRALFMEGAYPPAEPAAVPATR